MLIENTLPKLTHNSFLSLSQSYGTCPSEQTIFEGDEETGTGSRPSAMQTMFEPGMVIDGSYEVRRLIGQGGMGQVYEAHDLLLNRRVAVKVSLPEIGFDPLMLEAQALAALCGRGVPAVYAIGTHGDLGYCVMERLRGRTLGAYMVQRFADGIFTVDETIDLLIGVADALAGVHEAGLVHRDLKPSNIMLATGDRTVLLDFGLFSTESRAGDEHKVCGSPRYIAPEVITADLRSGQAYLVDIYSLGIIAFTLLVGRTPFDDPSVTGLLSQHVNAAPPSLAMLRTDAPPRLVQLIGQMLAKRPEDRAFSSEAVAACLRTIRAGRVASETSRQRRRLGVAK